MTLGSLCDGIGGWQLAAVRAGIKPIWSSEIDSFCKEITARHFPNTIQLGDLTDLLWQPTNVDIITAGTPCQSLSIAGKREGLKGESGLFFKAVELVHRIRPSYFIWENVFGALSSNGGLDFRTVLEEILQERIPLPRYWSNAGVVDGRKCQVAWRLLDGQYWGVPQRRKRIFLIADFAGRRAAEILFERESLSRDTAEGESKECDTTDGTGECANPAIGFKWNVTCNAAYDKTPVVTCHHPVCTIAYGLKLNATCDTARELQPALRTAPFACVATKAVRRLTPVECERLQGLPDNWTEGGSDTARYKAIGNGMVQPIADWIMKRIVEVTA